MQNTIGNQGGGVHTVAQASDGMQFIVISGNIEVEHSLYMV